MYGIREIRPYENGDLRIYLDQKRNEIKQLIECEKEDYILNVNETEYVNYYVNKYKMDTILLDFENASAHSYEKMIPAERFPQGYFVFAGKSYPKNVIVIQIPYQGDITLIKYRPTTFLTWVNVFYDEINREGKFVRFEYIQFDDNSVEAVEREYQRDKDHLNRLVELLNQDIEQWNNNLETLVRQIFEERKQILLKRRNAQAQLSVPFRKKENIPQTFAIPTQDIRKKIEVKKPVVTEKGFKPDPTLDQATYNDILKTIYDLGRQMERLPSVYSGKEEEHLRDHFLMFLEPRYEGSATGETFNKKGKTDILLRYENSNVFVAECKYWGGKKKYLETIDQLLGYLTWRDSKAAVIKFVDNKDFTSVLKTVKEVTKDHPNYLGFVDEAGESWFNYRFHINGDRNREVKLAVILFHFPKVE